MKRTRLSRVLGLSDLSILSSASMAPAYSIASTFGLMVAASGSGAILSLVALTIPIVFIAIAFHRLCEDQSDAGSTYAWSRVAFGYKPGAFAAWIVVLSYFFAAVAAVVPAGIYTLELLSSFGLLPETLNTVVTATSIFVGSTFVITGLACAFLHLRQTGQERHAFTGIALPAIGSLWTLGFLIFDVWKQQPAFIQWLAVIGIAVAFIFSVAAGRWVTSHLTAPAKEEEA